MALDPAQRFPVMCLTQDNLPLSHGEQVRRLCAVGARWIQLRMKSGTVEEWRAQALDVAVTCREHRAIFILNDHLDLALEVGADGVHLGKEDLDWTEARRRLGPAAILGGTVNNLDDAARARACGGLDYVGVGPLRFTSNKRKLAPILGLSGIASILESLEGELPAWVIGGVESADLPAIRAVGASGVAVSSALYRQGLLEKNWAEFASSWTRTPDVAVTSL